jgi:GSH-dependent disulfide-bond oxidoreductase
MAVDPIRLYLWPTPNGQKVAIMLEETGLPYEVVPVDITAGDQFEPEFLRISPNNKMPAIVDPDGPDGRELALFESGAILLYLAEKTGHFMPRSGHAYWQAMQWLMFQMGGVGPMLGQAHHFRNYAPERLDYAVKRYTNEAARLYGVLDRRLGEAEYIAGDDYTIVDMATWPWIRSHANQGQDLADFPNVHRWFEAVAARPAVQKGVELLADRRYQGRSNGGFDDKARDILFGDGQYQKR